MSKYVYIYAYNIFDFELIYKRYVGIFLDLLTIRIACDYFCTCLLIFICIYIHTKLQIQIEDKSLKLVWNKTIIIIMGLLRFFKSKSTQCLSDMVNNDHSLGKFLCLKSFVLPSSIYTHTRTHTVCYFYPWYSHRKELLLFFIVQKHRNLVFFSPSSSLFLHSCW